MHKDLISPSKDRIKTVESTLDCENLQSNHNERLIEKPKYFKNNLTKTFARSQKSIVHRSVKNSFGQNPIDDKVSQAASVDIQVENCRQYVEVEKLSPTIAASVGAELISTKSNCKSLKTGNNSTMAQINYNCIESVLMESHSSKNNKHYYGKTTNVGSKEGKKSEGQNVHNIEGKSNEFSKKFLWSSKSNKSLNKSLEKSQKDLNKSESVDKGSTKSKRSVCSPLKKLGRSSLTVEPDKITINLSKYSPCASRLAASSKILSADTATTQDSPLHIARSRSPFHVDVQTENVTKSTDKIATQASLCLNMQQFQKSRFAPRSRSVGDSCVTSPTSEATTLSYSPTNTEILSLEEVGPQIPSVESSTSCSDVKEKVDVEYNEKMRRATLETKC